jgi:hypothetical protein
MFKCSNLNSLTKFSINTILHGCRVQFFVYWTNVTALFLGKVCVWMEKFQHFGSIWTEKMIANASTISWIYRTTLLYNVLLSVKMWSHRISSDEPCILRSTREQYLHFYIKKRQVDKNWLEELWGEVLDIAYYCYFPWAVEDAGFWAFFCVLFRILYCTVYSFSLPLTPFDGFFGCVLQWQGIRFSICSSFNCPTSTSEDIS